MSRIVKSVGIENRLVDARGWGEKRMRNDYLKATGFLLGVIKIK